MTRTQLNGSTPFRTSSHVNVDRSAGNTVAGNTADENGLATATAPDASAGSGVILARPIPGGQVKGNLIIGNEFSGNGHAGVVLHAHAPGSDFSGNAVLYNRIGMNNGGPTRTT